MTTTRTPVRLALLATGVVAVAGAAVGVAPQPASAAPVRPSGLCSSGPAYRVVKQTRVSYRSMGTASGKYNASSNTSTLSLSLSLTKSRSSAWEGGATASVSFGIAQVEAHTSYTVTKTTTINKTSTDTVSVPGHYYGYAQPKAEYRTYHVYNAITNNNCVEVIVKNYGYFDAITAAPFFAECVAKSACTPKP